MTLAYFAYPIDVVIDHGHQGGARSLVRAAMHQAGWSVFEPGTTFNHGVSTSEELPDPRVQQINEEAIARADIVVALLPVESHSVGVPLEIYQAAKRGKTVYVWRQQHSWAIAEETVHQFRVVDDLCNAIATYGTVEKVQFQGDDIRESGEPVGAGLWDAWADRQVLGYAVPTEVARFSGDGRLPNRAYGAAAGFDLYVVGDHIIAPYDGARIPCGVSMELPPGWWGLMVGRSSTFDRGLLVNPTVIDPDYRGELFANVRNIRSTPVRVADGERIHQVVPVPSFPLGQPERVEQLSATERGANGFGSTGR